METAWGLAEAEDFVERLRNVCAQRDGHYYAWKLPPFIEECRALDASSAFLLMLTLFREASNIAAERARHEHLSWKELHSMNLGPHERGVHDLAALLLSRRDLRLTTEHALALLKESLKLRSVSARSTPQVPALVSIVEKRWAELSSDTEVRACLMALAQRVRMNHGWRVSRFSGEADGALAVKIEQLLNPDETFPIDPGEAWTDAVIADLRATPPDIRRIWIALLHHCLAAKTAEPSSRWSATASTLVEGIGRDRVRERLLAWFSLLDGPRTDTGPYGPNGQARWNSVIWPHHASVLRGFCWLLCDQEDAELARTFRAVATACYRKGPGGHRAVKVGTAAVYALRRMPGRTSLAHLTVLRTKIKFGTAQTMIRKAFDAIAMREGIAPSEIEELAAPTYFLTGVGVGERVLGEHRAAISVDADSCTNARLTWIGPNQRALRSTPAAVRKDFAEDTKELGALVKDMRAMLASQRDRIDALFIEPRSWTLANWRERYLDHPLVGVIARRLIWLFDDGTTTTAAAWLRDCDTDPPHGAGRLVRADGSAFDPPDHATVKLWRPIDLDGADGVRADVLDWRRFYEDRAIRQPFKQAHREVYLLTEEERSTAVYSNRFAGHILNQRTFHGLTAQRFWRNQLRMNVDSPDTPAYRFLQPWKLRAEFWTQAAGEETTDSGTFLRIQSDQVRFYRTDDTGRIVHWRAHEQAAIETPPRNSPAPLAEIPPLVFSEIMRDIDLFVSVSSVGLDTTWKDSGEADRFRDFVLEYRRGPLSPWAIVTRDVLGRLVPKLKIAPSCTITDRFLVVIGRKGTYKIHLGSAEVFMTPDDRPLCIVLSRKMFSGGQNIFLPFEGDHTLSLILSKAFLLADDDKITDPAILRQIERA